MAADWAASFSGLLEAMGWPGAFLPSLDGRGSILMA